MSRPESTLSLHPAISYRQRILMTLGSSDEGAWGIGGEMNMRMDAYFYEFTPTGVAVVDNILCAVASAGKAYHHTRDWSDGCDEWENCVGNNPVEWIQNAARKAANHIAGLREGLMRLQFAPTEDSCEVPEHEEYIDADDKHHNSCCGCGRYACQECKPDCWITQLLGMR